MTLKSQILLDIAGFYNTDEFAIDVVYTPQNDFAKTIPALVDYGVGEDYQGADNLGMIATMRIQVSGDDGIESVEAGDEIEIEDDGYIWKMLNAKKSPDGLEWICIINRLREMG